MRFFFTFTKRCKWSFMIPTCDFNTVCNALVNECSQLVMTSKTSYVFNEKVFTLPRSIGQTRTCFRTHQMLSLIVSCKLKVINLEIIYFHHYFSIFRFAVVILILKNLKILLWKKVAFDCAGIRAQVFRVDNVSYLI